MALNYLCFYHLDDWSQHNMHNFFHLNGIGRNIERANAIKIAFKLNYNVLYYLRADCTTRISCYGDLISVFHV